MNNHDKEIRELKRLINNYLPCDYERDGLYIPYMELFVSDIHNHHLTIRSKYNPTIDRIVVNVNVPINYFIDLVSNYKFEYNNGIPFHSQKYTKELKSIISR